MTIVDNPDALVEQVDVKVAAIKASVGGSGVVLWNLTLNEWVAVATIIYMLMQIIVLLPKLVVIIKAILGKKNA